MSVLLRLPAALGLAAGDAAALPRRPPPLRPLWATAALLPLPGAAAVVVAAASVSSVAWAAASLLAAWRRRQLAPEAPAALTAEHREEEASASAAASAAAAKGEAGQSAAPASPHEDAAASASADEAAAAAAAAAAAQDGYWSSLERARDEVRRARRQLDAAAGGVGLLPDGRPKVPRAPDGKKIDARPLFQLERLLGKAFEQAEEEAWRRTHAGLIRDVAAALEGVLSPHAARARAFCGAVALAGRRTDTALGDASGRLYAVLPVLGRDYIGPHLGLTQDVRGTATDEVSPLVTEPEARSRLLAAVEALVAMPWDDADDEDCYTARKWEAMGGFGA